MVVSFFVVRLERHFARERSPEGKRNRRKSDRRRRSKSRHASGYRHDANGAVQSLVIAPVSVA
jgi:hypothetical protein